eukprot:XP_001689439.1 predicted protein [Chlamydomonas reinhardtii]
MRVKLKKAVEVAFLDVVLASPRDELPRILEGFKWTYDKGDFNHWVELFNLFDEVLEGANKDRPELGLGEPASGGKPASELPPFPEETCIAILRTTSVILEHCSNKHLYHSSDRLAELLATDRDELLTATLHTLEVMVRKTQSSSVRWQGSRELNGRLSAMCHLWGGADQGLDMTVCASEGATPSKQALAEATTLTFQFHPSGGASGSPTTITVPGVDRLGESAHALAARLWQQHNVPAPQRFLLLSKARVAMRMGSLQGRRTVVTQRLLAHNILLNSMPTPDELAPLAGPESEFVSDLVSLIAAESGVPEPLRSLALRSLASLVTSTAGGTALADAGVAGALLPLLRLRGSDHVGLVTAAVRVLEGYIDFAAGTATAAFGDASNGLQELINRLVFEDSAAASPPKVPYARTTLIKFLLRCLALACFSPQSTAASRPPEGVLQALYRSLGVVLRDGARFGGSLFALAATVVSDCLHADPLQYRLLEEAGLPQAYLEAVKAGLLPSTDAVCSLPGMLVALCLNTGGLARVREARALEALLPLLTGRRYGKALSGDSAQMLGAGLEELFRFTPSLRLEGVDVVINTVRALCVLGAAAAEPAQAQAPVPYDFSAVLEEAAGVKDGDAFLTETISHVTRMLEGLVTHPETSRLLVERGLLALLLKLPQLPRLPFTFAFSSSSHPLLARLADEAYHVLLDSRRRSCHVLILNYFVAIGGMESLARRFEQASENLGSRSSTASMTVRKDPVTVAEKCLTSYLAVYEQLSNAGTIFSTPQASVLLAAPLPTAAGAAARDQIKDPVDVMRVIHARILSSILPVWRHACLPACSPPVVAALVSILRVCAEGTSQQASIVEMGFSAARAEEAIRRVGANSVEAAMEWLLLGCLKSAAAAAAVDGGKQTLAAARLLLLLLTRDAASVEAASQAGMAELALGLVEEWMAGYGKAVAAATAASAATAAAVQPEGDAAAPAPVALPEELVAGLRVPVWVEAMLLAASAGVPRLMLRLPWSCLLPNAARQEPHMLAILRHVLEDPATLGGWMEAELRNFFAQRSRNAAGGGLCVYV